MLLPEHLQVTLLLYTYFSCYKPNLDSFHSLTSSNVVRHGADPHLVHFGLQEWVSHDFWKWNQRNWIQVNSGMNRSKQWNESMDALYNCDWIPRQTMAHSSMIASSNKRRTFMKTFHGKNFWIKYLPINLTMSKIILPHLRLSYHV